MPDHDETSPSPESAERESTPEIAAALVENHRRFLAFLERRLGDRALAEDVLHDALVRSMDKLDGLHDRESIVPWFYRVLRNAVIDLQRRRASSARALAAFAAELETIAPEEDTHDAVCACVKELARTLRPEYAHALERIEVEGVAVKDFADEVGITSGNAAVRVFRARDALRKQVQRACGTCADHGCVTCDCRRSAGA